jgi:transcriptional regulator with XRE-family HTH domain
MTGGQNIRKLREQIGLTQTQFAAAVGIASITLSQYERNARHPSVKTAKEIIKFAHKKGINIDLEYIRPD